MLVLGTGGQRRAPQGSRREHLSTAYNQTQQIKGHVCVVETGAALLCPTRQADRDAVRRSDGDVRVGVYPEVAAGVAHACGGGVSKEQQTLCNSVAA